MKAWNPFLYRLWHCIFQYRVMTEWKRRTGCVCDVRPNEPDTGCCVLFSLWRRRENGRSSLTLGYSYCRKVTQWVGYSAFGKLRNLCSYARTHICSRTRVRFNSEGTISFLILFPEGWVRSASMLGFGVTHGSQNIFIATSMLIFNLQFLHWKWR